MGKSEKLRALLIITSESRKEWRTCWINERKTWNSTRKNVKSAFLWFSHRFSFEKFRNLDHFARQEASPVPSLKSPRLKKPLAGFPRKTHIARGFRFPSHRSWRENEICVSFCIVSRKKWDLLRHDDSFFDLFSQQHERDGNRDTLRRSQITRQFTADWYNVVDAKAIKNYTRANNGNEKFHCFSSLSLALYTCFMSKSTKESQVESSFFRRKIVETDDSWQI